MFTMERPNWISYLFYGSLAIVLSWMTSGCRFGNRTETQAGSSSNSDPYSGYYVTAPKSLSFLVTTTSTVQKSADVSQIPSEISTYLTNPVALVVTNLNTGKAVITSPAMLNSDQGTSLPINLKSDLSLSFHGQSTSAELWTDTACQSYLDFQESGKVTQNTNIQGPSGNTLALSGQLQLTFKITNYLSGDCTATLQFFANCYQDSTQCEGSTSDQNLRIQAAIQDTFAPYIDSGAMNFSDFPSVTSYGYEAAYD